MDKPTLFRTFIRVAELGSFSAAADSLGLPRSTASEQVRQLEALLGTRLLQRTTRRVQVTADGQAFAQRARALLEQLDDVEGLFRGDRALSGRLRVELPLALACNQVIPHLEEFLAAHPYLQLELCSGDRRVDPLRDGFDCVLRIGEPRDDALIVRRLGGLPQVNCASADYLRRFGTPTRLEDLTTQRLVGYGPFEAEGFEYRRDGHDHRLPMPTTLAVDNSQAYKAACLAGLGIIQVPRIGVAEALENGTLVEILEDYRPAPMPVSLLYTHPHLPRRVRVFMEWLQARLATNGLLEIGASDSI